MGATDKKLSNSTKRFCFCGSTFPETCKNKNKIRYFYLWILTLNLHLEYFYPIDCTQSKENCVKKSL
jgi:hypothetical protein